MGGSPWLVLLLGLHGGRRFKSGRRETWPSGALAPTWHQFRYDSLCPRRRPRHVHPRYSLFHPQTCMSPLKTLDSIPSPIRVARSAPPHPAGPLCLLALVLPFPPRYTALSQAAYRTCLSSFGRDRFSFPPYISTHIRTLRRPCPHNDLPPPRFFLLCSAIAGLSGLVHLAAALE